MVVQCVIWCSILDHCAVLWWCSAPKNVVPDFLLYFDSLASVSLPTEIIDSDVRDTFFRIHKKDTTILAMILTEPSKRTHRKKTQNTFQKFSPAPDFPLFGAELEIIINYSVAPCCFFFISIRKIDTESNLVGSNTIRIYTQHDNKNGMRKKSSLFNANLWNLTPKYCLTFKINAVAPLFIWKETIRTTN